MILFKEFMAFLYFESVVTGNGAMIAGENSCVQALIMFQKVMLQGFTLIEMLIVVSIMAIVMAFALPAYSRFVAQSRVQSLMTGLSADLGHARIEAVRTGGNVRVCATDATASACSADAADWRRGWLLQVASGASWTTIMIKQEVPVLVASASHDVVTFAPSGRAGAAFRLTFTDASAMASSTLEVATYGAISLR